MNYRILTLGVAILLTTMPYLAQASVPVTARTNAPAAFAAQAGASGDEAITAKVKSEIEGDAEFRGSVVDVKTSSGVVTLSGETPTAVVRLKIVEKTKATDGVTKVVNKLKIAKSK